MLCIHLFINACVCPAQAGKSSPVTLLCREPKNEKTAVSKSKNVESSLSPIVAASGIIGNIVTPLVRKAQCFPVICGGGILRPVNSIISYRLTKINIYTRAFG